MRQAIRQHGNADGERIYLVQAYDTITPGGSGLADICTWDPTADDGAGGFGLYVVIPNGDARITVYDSMYFCMAFEGERFHVIWRGHSQRWEVLHPYGLIRRATTSANHVANATGTSANINYGASGTYAITFDGWQISNSADIPSSEKIIVEYLWGDRKWYSPSYRRT